MIKKINKVDENEIVSSMLSDYFQLDSVNLTQLYKTWSQDKYFASIGPHLPGLRILRQDPWE